MTNEQSARDGLEPCPGCGKDHTRVIGGPGTAGGPKYWAGCDICHWRTWGDTEAEAIAAWNTRTAQPNAAEPVATGSFACRICGEDTPHYHSPDEVREHDETERWVEESLRQFHQCEREYRAAHPSAAPSSQDAAERADVRGLVEVLRKETTLLLQNAEGCVVNHFAGDFQEFGMPMWLEDCRERIETALELLAALPTGEAQQGGEG